MANNPKRTNLAANTACDAMAALANSGLLRIYDGSQPATADTAITSQVLLAELTMNATAFGAAVAGVATANAITQDSAANATGTGGVAFGFTESETGEETFTGSAALEFGFALAGMQGAAVTQTDYGTRTTRRRQRLDIQPLHTGSGGVDFGFRVFARGEVDDDELVLLLAA